jgi:putative ABC transport system permease protein
MNLPWLAWRNIRGNTFRSVVVSLCAVLVAGFVLSTTLVIRGAESSLQLAMARLGADVVVVPQGAESKVESALLMGTPANVWMPAEKLDKLRGVRGVAVASPQLYLSTLKDAACCSVSDMFLVAYDPETDFTVQPWLEENLGGGLRLGESVGGTYVFVPPGEQNIKLYGYFLTLRGNLEPTGTGLDQSMFLTFDTARDMARISTTQAEEPLEIPEGSISAVLIKVAPGNSPENVALRIMHDVPDVTPITSPDLFQAYRKQLAGLLTTVAAVLALTWVLSVLLIGLIFSMAAGERKRELGALRALGATRRFVFQSLLAEAGILALTGAAIGLGLAALVTYLFRDFIMSSLGLPFILPSPLSLIEFVALGLLLALVSVTLAALFPALRISRLDPAVAMRE